VAQNAAHCGGHVRLLPLDLRRHWHAGQASNLLELAMNCGPMSLMIRGDWLINFPRAS
jgi:hypothetical protein